MTTPQIRTEYAETAKALGLTLDAFNRECRAHIEAARAGGWNLCANVNGGQAPDYSPGCWLAASEDVARQRYLDDCAGAMAEFEVWRQA